MNSGGRKSPTNLGHTLQHSDDDGGYLRLKVRAYYAAGALTLPGASAPPPPPAPPAPPAPAPAFTLAVSPSTLTIARGKAGTFTVSLTAEGGFSSRVSLSSTIAPSLNGSRTLGKKTLTPPGSTTLRISVGSRAKPGTYIVTVKGTSGGLTQTATATLVVP